MPVRGVPCLRSRNTFGAARHKRPEHGAPQLSNRTVYAYYEWCLRYVCHLLLGNGTHLTIYPPAQFGFLRRTQDVCAACIRVFLGGGSL